MKIINKTTNETTLHEPVSYLEEVGGDESENNVINTELDNRN